MSLPKNEHGKGHELLDKINNARHKRPTDDFESTIGEGTAVTEKNEDLTKATWQNLPQKTQLLLIALCRMSAPLTNSCLIPYLYFLVKSSIPDPDHENAQERIARITGLLVAAFPLGQMMTSMLWSRLSDTSGRRPAILLGLAISIVANVGFGFSRSIGMLVFWRLVAGAANGTEGVMRTITAEVVKESKHQPRAFLAPPVIFNSGRVIALAVGGCLADPVRNLSYLFGPRGLFNFSSDPMGVQWTLYYPYALPALFNAIVLTACLAAAIIWLRESLRNGERRQRPDAAATLTTFVKTKLLRHASNKYALIEEEEQDTSESAIAAHMELSCSSKSACQRAVLPTIWTRQVYRALITFTLLPLHNTTFLHIFPVLSSMPALSDQKPNAIFFKGGLGLSSPIIGFYLALFGIAGIILQLFIYPRMHSRIGTLGVFRIASAMFPIAYIVAPYLALIVDHSFAKWAGIVVVLFTQVMARTMAIPSSVLLLTEAVPHGKVLGTVHGAGNTVNALASACGPAIGGLLLATGIEIGAVGLVWWTWLFTVSVIALVWSFPLEESPHTLQNDSEET
jgi:MFS family permease